MFTLWIDRIYLWEKMKAANILPKHFDPVEEESRLDAQPEPINPVWAKLILTLWYTIAGNLCIFEALQRFVSEN
jgi:hypothetical protein